MSKIDELEYANRVENWITIKGKTVDMNLPLSDPSKPRLVIIIVLYMMNIFTFTTNDQVGLQILSFTAGYFLIGSLYVELFSNQITAYAYHHKITKVFWRLLLLWPVSFFLDWDKKGQPLLEQQLKDHFKHVQVIKADMELLAKEMQDYEDDKRSHG